MLVTNLLLKERDIMTSHRILQLNAASTAACAAAMLVARGQLHGFFGLQSPILLDILALGFLAYAAALGLAAHRRPVSRAALMFFTIADAIWVGASVVVLLLFWGQLTPIARLLVVAVGLVVEIFATLQFRAAVRRADVTGATSAPA
jgi:hypothetical protein